MAADHSASLRALAAKCRHLAKGIGTRETAEALTRLGAEYDRRADEAEARPEAGPPPAPE